MIKKVLKIIVLIYFLIILIGFMFKPNYQTTVDLNPKIAIQNIFLSSDSKLTTIETNKNMPLFLVHKTFYGSFIKLDYDKFIFQIYNWENQTKNYKITIDSCKNLNSQNSLRYDVKYDFNNLVVENNSIKNFEFNINKILKEKFLYEFNECTFNLIENKTIIFSKKEKIYMKK